MERKIRTDLAMEEVERAPESAGALPGVRSRTETRNGFHVTSVDILDEEGAKALCKPVGHYITLELDALVSRRENAFEDAAQLLADLLRPLLNLSRDDSTLVAGLGNDAITPDAVGPLAARSIMATRHLKERLPEDFAAFRPVAAIAPGVLGSTGIESAEVLKQVSNAVAPSRVIAVDALASASLERLCRTVQICDAGIVPGSGVGNNRAELSSKTLGVPVIAIGVPTVVDASFFTDDPSAKGMFVTPRDIDSSVRDTAKLIAYGVNLAMHDGLTIADIDMFIN